MRRIRRRCKEVMRRRQNAMPYFGVGAAMLTYRRREPVV
jgi:hypothetical protein